MAGWRGAGSPGWARGDGPAAPGRRARRRRASTRPPGATRRPGPTELFTAALLDRPGRARPSVALLDLVTIEDAFGMQSSRRGGPRRAHRPGAGPPRRRAHRLAAWPRSPRHIGLVPTATPTHTEPFHLASASPTLDYVSNGRAGWRPQVSARRDEAALVGLPDRARHRPGRSPATRRSPRSSTTCSTRRPTPSRSCAGCGTAGRTTPSSATSPPAASSTGTSSTTSTSRAASSP